MDMVIGYARISAREQKMQEHFPEPGDVSLDDYVERLKAAGCDKVYADVWHGSLSDCPEFERLCRNIQPGDTLVVPSLEHVSFYEAQTYERLLGWLRSGIEIKSLDKMEDVVIDEAVGHFRLHILLSIYEYVNLRYLPKDAAAAAGNV